MVRSWLVCLILNHSSVGAQLAGILCLLLVRGLIPRQ